MRLRSIRLTNFRSILDQTLNCDELTILVGANGSGKSTFLRAINIFNQNKPKLDQDDWYNKNTTVEITITATFVDIPEDLLDQIKKYVSDNKLIIKKTISYEDDKLTSSFYGKIMRNNEFNDVYVGNATEAKAAYSKLKNTKYKDFPSWSNHQKVKNYLSEWEQAHPEKCDMTYDEGKFFGFGNSYDGNLAKFVQFLYIPSILDPVVDSTDDMRSTWSQLMNRAVRSKLLNNAKYTEFQNAIKVEYENAIRAAVKKDMDVLDNMRNTPFAHMTVPISVQTNRLRILSIRNRTTKYSSNFCSIYRDTSKTKRTRSFNRSTTSTSYVR